MKAITPSKLVLLLSGFEDYNSNEQFTEVDNSFYNTFLLYLQKWNNNLKLLQEILLSQKYETSAQEEESTPSPSAEHVWMLSTIY
jgi:hypothetical protein